MSVFQNIYSALGDTMMEGAGGGAANELTSTLIMFGLIFAVFYFLLIRPQQKRQKEHQGMLESLKRGDEIITTGGLHGTIKAVTPQTMRVEISQGVTVTIEKSQIATTVSQSDASGKSEQKEK